MITVYVALVMTTGGYTAPAELARYPTMAQCSQAASYAYEQQNTDSGTTVYLTCVPVLGPKL